ncbi:MAG: succinate dehydrogenase, hydrophobic membrane anchor protein, partial [Rhodospirillales bacterium]|nr:succinate dehydrogenase, hydrophobic membrane anchor protein [Rhodospirillales bacterium]
MRTPLARARGLGSAKEGVHHWWAQRATAVALIPLSLWFVGAVVELIGMDYLGLKAWMGVHGNLTMMILFISALFWHAQLGVAVVIEDYVHNETIKNIALVAARVISLVMGASTI